MSRLFTGRVQSPYEYDPNWRNRRVRPIRWASATNIAITSDDDKPIKALLQLNERYNNAGTR